MQKLALAYWSFHYAKRIMETFLVHKWVKGGMGGKRVECVCEEGCEGCVGRGGGVGGLGGVKRKAVAGTAQLCAPCTTVLRW